MHLKSLTLAAFCIFLTRCLVLVKADNTEKELEHYLFVEQGYDKHVRPVQQSSDVVPVFMQLAPITLREVDDKLHVLAMDTSLIVVWEDQYLQWNPSEFGGLYNFRLPAEKVWLPDLGVYTGTPDSSNFPSVKPNVVVNSTGNVMWIPPFTMQSRCSALEVGSIEVECVISLASWSYGITQLNLNILNPVNMNFFQDTYPGWHLDSIVQEREVKTFRYGPEPYATINIRVRLNRRPL